MSGPQLRDPRREKDPRSTCLINIVKAALFVNTNTTHSNVPKHSPSARVCDSEPSKTQVRLEVEAKADFRVTLAKFLSQQRAARRRRIQLFALSRLVFHLQVGDRGGQEGQSNTVAMRQPQTFMSFSLTHTVTIRFAFSFSI